MAYERIDDPYRTPQNHIGERPYEGPIGAIKNLINKIGQRRLAGISGVVMAPTGPGVSDFQAGFGGYQAGVKGYDQQILDSMKLAQQQDIAERRVSAQEQTAAAASSRASSYKDWVGKDRTPRGGLQTKKDILDYYAGLSPERQEMGRDAGVFPRGPSGGKPDNEDQMVKSLMDQYGMTEPHARLIANIRPGLTGTTDTFTEDPKTKEIRRQAKRTFAVPKKIAGILALYGLKPDDIFSIGDTEGYEPPPGFGNPTGGEADEGGDEVAPDSYDDLGIDELESILHDYDSGDLELNDDELQLIMERLERMAAEGEAVEQRMDQRNRFQY